MNIYFRTPLVSFISAFCFSGAGQAQDLIEASVNLLVDSEVSFVDHTVSVTVFGEDSGRSQVTGEIVAVVSFDPLSGEVVKFGYTGGELVFSPVELDLTDSPVATLSVDFSEITVKPESPLGADSLENDEGILNMLLHQFTPTAGTITVSTPFSSEVINVTDPTEDGEVDTDTIAGLELVKIVVTKVESLGNGDRWEVVFEGSGDAQGDGADSGVAVNFASATNLRAFGSVFVSNVDTTTFAGWLEREGLAAGTAPESLNLAGISRSFLFAFDLPDRASSLPLAVVLGEGGSPQARVTCPPGGLRQEVKLEAIWEGADATTPLTSFAEGASGEQIFTLPNRAKAFVRLVID